MNLDEKVQLWWDRFNCRKDVFGKGTSRFDPKKNKLKKYVFPSHIKKYVTPESRAGINFTSPSELFDPLTKENVKNHLLGLEEILIYLPRLEDNTTDFFAIDFDYQHGFKETQNVSRIFSTHGIPHLIARSTSKGHHIYVFMNGPIKAHIIHNFMNEVYLGSGYYDKIADVFIDANGRKWTNPEIFPKVTSIGGPSSPGYCIKPALNRQALENDRCCFVDINDKVIGGKGTSPKQWEALKDVEQYDVSKFMKLLKDLDIDINEHLRVSETRGADDRDYGKVVPYKNPEDGDIMAVINGCPAFRRMWKTPLPEWGHDGAVSLLSNAIHCKNGLPILEEKFCNSDEYIKQKTYALNTNQRPWCCKTMQLKDVCIAGVDPLKTSGDTVRKGECLTDYCFEKSAPRREIDGKIKINPDDLSVEEWPWPSPGRLRTPFVRTGVEGLKQKIKKLSKEDPDLDSKLSVITREIAGLDDAKSRDKVLKYLQAQNVTLVKNIKHIYGEAINQKSEEKHMGTASDGGYKSVNGKQFFTLEPSGYSSVRTGPEGEDTFVSIANFEIRFDFDKSYFPAVGDPSRIFSGTITCGNSIQPFQIKAEDYPNNNKLSSAIFNSIGPDADFKNGDLDLIRSAVNLFGCLNIRKIITHENYGYNEGTNPTLYRTKKGVLTANGFTTNEKEESVVELSREAGANKLELKEIDKEELVKTVDIILNNYLSLQEPIATYTTLAHTFQAAIHNVYIPFNEAPCLYLDGTTGVGKSDLALFAQNFHGKFDAPLSIKTTLGSINLSAMLFKDALFLLDDYKLGQKLEGKVIDIIQKAYDRSERGRLRSDFSQGDVMINRSLMVFTGESLPTAEASVIARLIHVPMDHKIVMNKITKGHYDTVKKNLKYFPGVMAKFIQFMLQNYPDKEVVFDKFNGVLDVFRDGVASGIQNGPRITNNLAANFMAWELFLEFLLTEALISRSKFDELHETHRLHILELRTHMFEKCVEEQASNIFLGILKEQFASGNCIIHGLSSSDDRGSAVGFVESKQKGVIYLFPGEAYKIVAKHLRESNSDLNHSQDSIGKQLKEDGFLLQCRKQSTAVQKRFRGVRSYMWAIDAVKTGFGVILADAADISPAEELPLQEMPLDKM